MIHAETQTDDILINGIPLSEFIKNNTSQNDSNDSSLWDFVDNEVDDEADDYDTEDESKNIDNGSNSADLLSEKDIQQLSESILYCIDENVMNNPLLFSDPSYHQKLEDSIYDIIHSTFTFSDSSLTNGDMFKFTEEMEEQLEEIINDCLNEYFQTIVPPRSYPDTSIIQAPNIAETLKKIEYLKSIPQDEQRTAGWYIFRNKLITASAAWKVFKTESYVNHFQLIFHIIPMMQMITKKKRNK